ncbi:Hypothetical protein POVR2_LOCUS151 [uncultured virus]|nr:Hypothetical protein POVR2_LOCUS151 [uncultured virus]
MSLLPVNDLTDLEQFEQRVRDWLQFEMSVDVERADVINFLEQAVAAQREDLVELFVEIMREEVPREEEMPYLAYLLTHKLSDDVLDSLVQAFEPEYYHMVSGLLTSLNEDHIAMGIANVKRIFAGWELDRDALELLQHEAVEKESTLIADYLTAELEQDEDNYAVVPEWIIPGKRSHSDLIASIVLPNIQPWISKSAEDDARYVASLVEEDRDIEDVYNQLVSVFSTQTAYERQEQLSKLVEQNSLMLLQDDPEIFRVLGPCLPMGPAYELKLKSLDPCNMYGGCRSYTCYENHNLNADTSEALIENPVGNGRLAELEWFTGRCNNPECKLLIRKKSHALRMPVVNEGGWLGCYCSFYCLRSVADDSSDALTNLLAIFEGKYLQHGIYERDD